MSTLDREGSLIPESMTIEPMNMGGATVIRWLRLAEMLEKKVRAVVAYRDTNGQINAAITFSALENFQKLLNRNRPFSFTYKSIRFFIQGPFRKCGCMSSYD